MEKKELADALQELRFTLMADGRVRDAKAIEEALRARVNGRLVRELLIDAYLERLARLIPERDGLRDVLRKNGDRVPITPEAEDRLRFQLEVQIKRLDRINMDIAHAASRLRELGAPLPAGVELPAPATDEKPSPGRGAFGSPVA